MKGYLAEEQESIKKIFFFSNFFFIGMGDPWDNLKNVEKPMQQTKRVINYDECKMDQQLN